MRLTPRYDGAPVLDFRPAPGDPSVPLLRQRRRLAATLATLTDDQWASPSRCDGWACRDVVSHLVTVNAFWATSFSAGRSGEPTRFLTGFDPATTPAQLVDAAPDTGTDELLESFVTTTDTLADALEGLDASGWALAAECPPGHLAISFVALHALWDGWIHERDIVLPLGLDAVEEPDEVAGALRYAVGIGPAFLATTGSVRTGTFALQARHPDVDLVVDVGPRVLVRDGRGAEGTPTLAGGAVALTESFSLRTTPPALPGSDAWMVEGLAVLFDQAG